jgi:hypothetical protein
MATDFTKMPLEIITDLINFTNGCALSPADILYGPVKVLTSGNRNTGVTITAVPSSPYSGTRDLSYNRVDMAIIPGLRSTAFDLTGCKTMKDVVPKINEAYRINLQPEDYYDDILPDLNDPTLNDHNFVLRAKPASYVYIGMLVLSGIGGKTIISDYLTQNLLSGFVLPDYHETLYGDKILNGFSFPNPSA